LSSNVEIIRLHDDQDNANIVLRAAIYARYSSVGNTPESARDQIKRIRERLQRGAIRSSKFPNAKIEIDEAWVLADEAQTGRVSREEYERIKSGVRLRSFDVLLLDDLSRATRDMGGTLDLYDAVIFSGVEGISVADGISTIDPNARDLFVFKGYANEAQSKAISKATMRGLETRVYDGYSTGHNPWGYYSTPTMHLEIKGVLKPSKFEIKIDYEKAQIIVRIWTMFGEYIGVRNIAKALNDDGVPPPITKGKRVNPRWTDKLVWYIVNQKKYVGLWRYRQTRVVKDPYREKMAQVSRPRTEWLVSKREDLRIVPVEIEEKVNRRTAELAKERSEKHGGFGNRGGIPSHLFIGSLRCSACKGIMITASGRSGGYAGCANAHRQYSGVCSNKRMIKLSTVQHHLTDFLRSELDRPETYSYIAKRYNELIMKKSGTIPQKLAMIESQVADLERSVANFVKFVESGSFSEAVIKGLADAEDRLKHLRAERDYLRTQVGSAVFITPSVVRDRMSRLDDVLNKKVVEANRILKLIFPDDIILEPTVNGRKIVFVATGTINLFAMVQFKIDGISDKFASYVETTPTKFQIRLDKSC
jgi:DNA invertase Pin-like site-specific DNA recombinase